jgi:hypothetical protein
MRRKLCAHRSDHVVETKLEAKKRPKGMRSRRLGEKGQGKARHGKVKVKVQGPRYVNPSEVGQAGGSL